MFAYGFIASIVLKFLPNHSLRRFLVNYYINYFKLLIVPLQFYNDNAIP